MRLAHPRFILFLSVLVALAAALWRPLGGARAVSAGFDLAALGYIAWMSLLMRRADADSIRAHAAANDAGRATLLLIAVVVTAVVLATVALELGPAMREPASMAFAVATIIVAWLFGNHVYTVHYAHLYYDQENGRDAGGLEFPGAGTPDYWDFAYFAFTNGMAFAVSDVDVTTRTMRRTVLLHCVIAFFFNLGVLALAINIVAGALGSG